MSAAAAPELRIVPPDAPDPAPLAAPVAPAADPAAQARRMARVRAVGTAMCVTGALLPLPCVASQAYLGDTVWVGMIFSWVFLLPLGGLALLIAAATRRTRAELSAMLLAAATFAASVPLLSVAGRAGREAYVASHFAEMEALARRSRTEWVAELPGSTRSREANLALGRDLRARGFEGPFMADGGIVFHASTPFDPDLLYADGGKAGPNAWTCRGLRPIGGHWYMALCGTSDYD